MSGQDFSEAAIRNYKMVNARDDLAPRSPINEAAMDFVFGKVWEMEGLSTRERRLVSLTCTAMSGQSMPLEAHVRGALDSGDFTVAELQAFGIHLAAYAGFPIGTSIEVTLRKLERS